MLFAANARLAASVAKNMADIKRGLGLNDKQAAVFRESLTKILTDAFSGGQGGGEDASPQVDNGEKIPGYEPGRITELKKRGYRWNGKKWEK